MRTIFSLLAFVLLLIGCSKVPDSAAIPSNLSMDYSEAKMVMTNTGYADAVLTDEEYVVPTEDWVNKTFTPAFKQFLFDYNVRVYADGQNECDKFSLYARSIANVLNRHNPNGNGAGIAFGEVYLMTGLDGHAMNFIIVAGSDKKPKLVFYEPQIQQIVTMSTNDLVILEWRM